MEPKYIERKALDKALTAAAAHDKAKNRRTWAKAICVLHDLPAVDVEKMSDGYHTFDDLYEQRLILSAALAKNNPHAWKSKRHEDGSVPFGGGWFIMGFDTDEGCYTYHYELKDWGLFQCKELERGKPWDGHTSKDVRRLLSIPAADVAPVVHGRWIGSHGLFQGKCSVCGYMTFDKSADWARDYWPYCPNCGAKMDGGVDNATD